MIRTKLTQNSKVINLQMTTLNTTNNTLNKNVLSRLAIPKSKAPCCSKNCGNKTIGTSIYCANHSLNNTFKHPGNIESKGQTNYLRVGGIKNSNENDSLNVNSLSYKSSLLNKRNLFNERIKNNILNKGDYKTIDASSSTLKSQMNEYALNGKNLNNNGNNKHVTNDKNAFRERSRCYNSSAYNNNQTENNEDTKSTVKLECTGKYNYNSKCNYNTIDYQEISSNANLPFKKSDPIIINNHNNYYINQIYPSNNDISTQNAQIMNNQTEVFQDFDSINKKVLFTGHSRNSSKLNSHANTIDKENFEIVGENTFQFIKTESNYHHNYNLSSNNELNLLDKIRNNITSSNFSTLSRSHTLHSFTTSKQRVIDQLNKELLNKEIDRNLYCFKKLQTFKDWEYYGKEFKKQLFIDQQIHRRSKVSNLFQNNFNKVNERMRAKMVDWMIEVLYSYETNENTFFLAVELLDSYLTNNCSRLILPSDLHLIGCTCMFIASKILDIRPLKLKTIYEKIAHEKLSTKEIKDQEVEILKVLKFNVYLPTIYEYSSLYSYELFILLNEGNLRKDSLSCDNSCTVCNCSGEEIKLEELNLELKSSNEEFNKQIKQKTIHVESFIYNNDFILLFKSVLTYVQKLIFHDYKLTSEYPSVLAAGSIVVAFKICEQITKCSFLTNNIVVYLQEISDISNYELIVMSQNILKLCQEFEEVYKGLENLNKIHVSEITSFTVKSKKD